MKSYPNCNIDAIFVNNENTRFHIGRYRPYLQRHSLQGVFFKRCRWRPGSINKIRTPPGK